MLARQMEVHLSRMYEYDRLFLLTGEPVYLRKLVEHLEEFQRVLKRLEDCFHE